MKSPNNVWAPHMSDQVPVSVGILSYKAHKTIDATLHAYTQKNFLKPFPEVKLFFQCVSDEDVKISQKYDLEYMGRPDNIGIQDGMRWVVENLKSDYILYLENDCPLITDAETAQREIRRAVSYLAQNKIDVMRLRSRFSPEAGLSTQLKYTKVYPVVCQDSRVEQRTEVSHRPNWFRHLCRFARMGLAVRIIGHSVYIEKDPEKKHPRYIQKMEEDFYIVDSCALNWTNQSILTTKKFFLEMLDYADAHPCRRTVNGMQDMEKPLNCRWWRNQHFKIGVSCGLFTHKRLDR